MGILEKIAEIEAEVRTNCLALRFSECENDDFGAGLSQQMARTQRNKATAHHLGLLKARLAKLRRELLTPKSGGGGTGEGGNL